MSQIKQQEPEKEVPENNMEEEKQREDHSHEFVKPHKVKSRLVEESDCERVAADSEKMFGLCNVQVGIYPAGFAVAHPQITSEDPLRFFVTSSGLVVVNPEIVRHSNYQVEEAEGCLTFHNVLPIRKARYRIVELEFNELEKGEDGKWHIGPREHSKFKGREARIAQHEVEHLDATYLYGNLFQEEETKQEN